MVTFLKSSMLSCKFTDEQCSHHIETRKIHLTFYFKFFKTVLLPYRNKFPDLQWKLTDWFLFDGTLVLSKLNYRVELDIITDNFLQGFLLGFIVYKKIIKTETLKLWKVKTLTVKNALSIIFNQFQPSDAFHIENSHLIFTANQMTGFYMKCNTGLKWVNKKMFPYICNNIEKSIKSWYIMYS